MAHSYSAGNTTFTYSPDLSGPVQIRHFDGARITQTIEIPGDELAEFMLEWLRERLVSTLENADISTLIRGK